jgi:GTP1/Obg family GTP-binding protein
VSQKIVSSLLGLVLLCVSSTALAQGSTQISDKELAAFAKAYAEVQKIRAQYEPSLQKTKNPKENERIQREANARLKKTLDKQGLSVDRYNKIYAAVNSNEDLRRKTLRMVEQERKKS